MLNGRFESKDLESWSVRCLGLTLQLQEYNSETSTKVNECSSSVNQDYKNKASSRKLHSRK